MASTSRRPRKYWPRMCAKPSRPFSAWSRFS
jgi:hypothetical protein